jgi:hypothetical protein
VTRRRTSTLLLLAVLACGACAASERHAKMDPPQVHGINCSGPDKTWNVCAERAVAICGPRYDVLAAGGGTAYMIETLSPSAGFGGPPDERSIFIRCR